MKDHSLFITEGTPKVKLTYIRALYIICFNSVTLKGGDMIYQQKERRASSFTMFGIVVGAVFSTIFGVASAVIMVFMFGLWSGIYFLGLRTLVNTFQDTQKLLGVFEITLGLALLVLFLSLIRSIGEDDSVRNWLRLKIVVLGILAAILFSFFWGFGEVFGRLPIPYVTNFSVVAIPIIHAGIVLLCFLGFLAQDAMSEAKEVRGRYAPQ